MISGLSELCETGGVLRKGSQQGGSFICRLLNLFCLSPLGKGSGEDPNAALSITGPHMAIQSLHILPFLQLCY